MRSSLGPGVKVPGAVAADGVVFGVAHPAAMNKPSATANTMAAKYFVLMKLIVIGTASTQFSAICSERNLFARPVLIDTRKWVAILNQIQTMTV
jgi:hypothetical protein